jgi:hypothetical protein
MITPRRLAPWFGLAVGLALLGAGSTDIASTGPRLPDVGSVPSTYAPAAPPPDAVIPVATLLVPRHLRLPTLGVSAQVVPVLPLPDGELAVPDEPSRLGWWSAGGTPGAGYGTVVLDGHVDTRRAGPGALFRLADLRPGDPIVIEADAGHAFTYTVRAVHSYPKRNLPSDVFARSGAARLVLITCGGSFDQATHEYADNVVAYATPAHP